MRHVNMNASFCSDRDRLFNGLPAPGSFVANMRNIQTIQLRWDLREGCYLISFREGPGYVDQSGGETQSTIAHCTIDQILHLCHLSSRRNGRPLLHYTRANSVVADKSGDVNLS